MALCFPHYVLYTRGGSGFLCLFLSVACQETAGVEVGPLGGGGGGSGNAPQLSLFFLVVVIFPLFQLLDLPRDGRGVGG